MDQVRIGADIGPDQFLLVLALHRLEPLDDQHVLLARVKRLEVVEVLADPLADVVEVLALEDERRLIAAQAYSE
jgi:hypothetical protein